MCRPGLSRSGARCGEAEEMQRIWRLGSWVAEGGCHWGAEGLGGMPDGVVFWVEGSWRGGSCGCAGFHVWFGGCVVCWWDMGGVA